MRSPRKYPLEKTIEKQILSYLNSLPKTKAWKNKSQGTWDQRGFFRKNNSAFTEKGTSDIIGIWNGRMLCIEVKSKTGKLRPEQAQFLINMESLGAIAFVARSIEDVITRLASIVDHK